MDSCTVALITDPLALPPLLRAGQPLLGLDLGTKRLGLALSDSGLMIATPYGLLTRTKFTADAQELAALVRHENIGALVIGMPYNMDGSEGRRAQATRAFIGNLRRFTDFARLPIALWDERLSTIAVTRTLLAADSSRAKRQSQVDKMAAAYILQGFLDRMGARK